MLFSYQEGSSDEGFWIGSLLVALTTVLLSLFVLFYPAYEARHGISEDIIHDTLLSSSSSSSSSSSNDDRNGTDKDKLPPVLLSIVIPAYNEESRLEKMLDAAFSALLAEPMCPGLKLIHQAYVNHNNIGGIDNKNKNNMLDKSNHPIVVEWVLVNDGSSDRTCQVYKSFVMARNNTKKTPDKDTIQMLWRLCSLSQNSGKGAAVQVGMMHARGHYRLMVDADGATEFGPGLHALAQHLSTHEFVFGSRGVATATTAATTTTDAAVVTTTTTTTTTTNAQRSWFRQLLQTLFHTIVVLVVGYHSVYDTQCGFKLFSGRIAERLFQGLHLHRWAFDIELFVRAHQLQLSIQEVPVPWQEIEGSKLHTSTWNVIKVALGMLRDMICVRLCYTFGIWTISSSSSSDEEKEDSSLSSSSRKKRQ